ncbi:hypothetical protein M569_05716 [Genlisea aurea]|uniref:Probable RNA-binding protein 18 n=1 Tax=Genlisea aurea TaxID=192259 RepID=S8CQM7_9LAMI|nr:hypothetical protein M569_05716 [Genlisea aurea]
MDIRFDICQRFGVEEGTLLEFELILSISRNDTNLNKPTDDKFENRLYIGNLDLRITEAALIKMFSPYGKIVSEDFLWHTRGPNRGEPRGYAFIQFSSKEEALLAKEKMHGRMACGRPLAVRLASEKTNQAVHGNSCMQVSRNAKIAAIKNKLKAMDEGSSKND